MSKIFGVGWAKTGTKTLGRAFEILGLDHQGPRLDLVPAVGRGDLAEVMAVARQKEAFEDWPWPILYRELDAAFPDSLFILTTRSSGSWIGSYRNMLRRHEPAPPELTETRRILYGLPFPDVTESQLVERYERHNTDVAQYFSHRHRALLTVDWEAGAGWAELCSFLGLDVPDEPFPHLNSGDYG